MKYIITLLSLFVILFSGCDEEEELAVREYPRLQTLPVSDVSAEGATFNASFLLRGEAEIVEYGFAWDKTKMPTLTESDRIIFQRQLEEESFSVDIRSTLERGKKYAVRAFVKTPDYLVYGERVTFNSAGSNPPVINIVKPLVGTVGDTIMLKGEGFSYCDATNAVFLKNMLATVVSATDKEVKVIVPRNIQPENAVRVNIAGSAALFGEPFRRSTPVIHSSSSDEVTKGSTFKLFGEGFSYQEGSNEIILGEQECQVVEASKRELSILVPTALAPGEYVLHLTVAGEAASYASIHVAN